MNRVLIIIAVIMMSTTFLLIFKREPIILSFLSLRTEKTSLAERDALIEKGMEIRLPEEGEGPFPVFMQLHGCAGIRAPFHRQWADVANEEGYAAMIVDSAGPRGYDRQKALDVICEGKALIGQERAGDILAAIDIIKKNNKLDENRIVVAGWSHGAWATMDYLTMDMKGRRPAGLKPVEGNAPEIEGAVLFYPYCGLGALSRFRNWPKTPPTLALVAGSDTTVDPQECLGVLEKRKAKGAPIDIVVYPDAEHVFDDPYLEPEWLHWYNEDYHAAAEAKVREFLKTLKAS